ncbi:AAA family ATPase [Polyangium spumosum]|uniref:AAA family ATPase n=1 Tax=Polyangium spumosum TaxID=889282 RepID=A0A6N7PLS0_9BACT|nr:ATP-binding protein [Polyangium spumosum]MRG92727.1 AAA family ATPase [Polyangium spumosum]
MIESLRLQNFKGHRDTTIEFGRLTVLVGPNGSGKTSVLQALELLGQVVRNKIVDVFSGPSTPELLVSREQEGTMGIHAHGSMHGKPWKLAVDITSATKSPHILLIADTGRKRGRATNPQFSFAGFGGDPLWPWLQSTTTFRIDAGQVAAPGYSRDGVSRVDKNGKNTAAALAALKLSDDPAFEEIERRLCTLVPSLKRIRFRQAVTITEYETRTSPNQRVIDEQQVTGNEFVFDFRGAQGVPAVGASEGTLVLLGLLTALHTNAKSGLLLIDDIEHSLHPTAQVQLMQQLRGLLTQMPDLQIVATTHSPYILDGVDPSDVRVFYPRDDGTIVTKRLSDHPDAQRVKGMLSSGELWSAESEAWVLGEDAAQ